MNYEKKYRKESDNFRSRKISCSGSVSWESPSNIALIKYWGKRRNQIPVNPSLSFTLDRSVTRTSIRFTYDQKKKTNAFDFAVNGEKNQLFGKRVTKYLGELHAYFPFLRYTDLEIDTENNYPHSAGIASSASAFSALALCLTDIDYRLRSVSDRKTDFYRKASFISRLGSGSASRSVYGGAVLWGKINTIKGSSDEIALPLKVHEVFEGYKDIVLLVDDKEKAISSSEGHRLMKTNPFFRARKKQARQNMEQLLRILDEGDTESFAELTEYEALSLHAMMMTSLPGYLLITSNTLAIIQEIRQYRSESRIPVAFTMDAGANVHLLFPGEYMDNVIELIKNELLGFCSERKYLINSIGKGPKQVYND
jgi:diphosphomevalonate decarboxylase